MPLKATVEERNRAVDILHRRIIAKHEARWLRDPADFVHVNSLSREFTRNGVAFITTAPEELFHYTTLQGFSDIIKSGVLRATDAEQCNDKKEVVHGRDLIAKCLDLQIQRAMPRSQRREFFEHFAKNLIHRVRPKYHVTCFSSRERGRSEWGVYADGGRGVILVMNLVDSVPDASIVASEEIVTLRPITYRLGTYLRGCLRSDRETHWATRLAREQCSICRDDRSDPMQSSYV
jgi:hypothetical protein